jgi:hypothetical protein
LKGYPARSAVVLLGHDHRPAPASIATVPINRVAHAFTGHYGDIDRRVAQIMAVTVGIGMEGFEVMHVDVSLGYASRARFRFRRCVYSP